MTQLRRLKKSESLEIRLPHPTKQAFMARCRAQGRSASEALRGFIDAEIAPAPSRAPRRPLRAALLGALALAAVGAAAAPSLAGPVVGAQFQALDANGDGAISAAEFARLDTDHDRRVTLDEFRRSAAAPARP